MRAQPLLETVLVAAALAATALPCAAADKLLLTGGVSSIDGTAGGGLTPWALIGGYGSDGQWGATAFASVAKTRDYRLVAGGVAVGIDDRVELSLARQAFDTGATGPALGVPGLTLRQDIAGLKWRVAGDAILDSDTWTPQVAIGVLAKRMDAGGLAPTLAALGARRDGIELYASATKLLLAQGLLLNATLRATRANQNGLLGFGGTAHHRVRLMPELSAAWLLQRTLAVGTEYRRKPDNLNPSLLGAGLKEDAWWDVFVAWAPNRQVSLTLAAVDLGRIVPAVQQKRQRAAYLSLQLAH